MTMTITTDTWYHWFFGSDAADADTDMFDIDDAEKVMQMISKVM